MSITGSKVGRSLEAVPVVMRFRVLATVGGLPAGWRGGTGALNPCPLPTGHSAHRFHFGGNVPGVDRLRERVEIPLALIGVA